MGRDNGKISRLVKEVMAKGRLERQGSSADKRRYILSLTASGKSTTTKTSLLEQGAERTSLNGLPKI